MLANKEFEIIIDKPSDERLGDDAAFSRIAEHRHLSVQEHIAAVRDSYIRTKDMLEAMASGERSPIIRERILMHEQRALDMETERRFDQSVTMSSLSTNVHNALGLPRSARAEDVMSQEGRITQRIDLLIRTNYKTISKDYKRAASEEAKKSLVGDGTAGSESVLDNAVAEVCTAKIADLEERLQAVVDTSEKSAEFRKDVNDGRNKKLGKFALFASMSTGLGGKKRDNEDKRLYEEGEEFNKMLRDLKSELMWGTSESTIFNEVQSEYNVKKRGVAEAIIDRAVEQFKQDMQSGQLINNFAGYVRSVLEREGLLGTTTREKPRTNHRATRPETAGGFDKVATRTVDGDISDLRATGASDKKIGTVLMRRYHPDLNSDDPSAEEKMKYLLSLHLR